MENEIKKTIVVDMLIERLYEGLEVNDKGKVVFDRYNLSEKELHYLLRNYNEEKYNAYITMLKEAKKNDND